MKVTKLPLGEPAPTDVDCIRIEQNDDGSFRLTASALCSGDDEAESASIVSQRPYASITEAESAGRAWADSLGSEHLFVSIGTIERPLKLQEMDLPL